MPDSSPAGPPRLPARIAAGTHQAVLTAAAAWISYAVTADLGLREGYWAAISAIVVMQSELEDTKSSARDRFLGTALGGVVAWGCALVWHHHEWIYALAVALSVLFCWLASLGGAGRLAAVAVTVIVLIPRNEPIWQIALFRFLEVSGGIAVAVGIASLAAGLQRRWRSAPSGQ